MFAFIWFITSVTTNVSEHVLSMISNVITAVANVTLVSAKTFNAWTKFSMKNQIFFNVWYGAMTMYTCGNIIYKLEQGEIIRKLYFVS